MTYTAMAHLCLALRLHRHAAQMFWSPSQSMNEVLISPAPLDSKDPKATGSLCELLGGLYNTWRGGIGTVAG